MSSSYSWYEYFGFTKGIYFTMLYYITETTFVCVTRPEPLEDTRLPAQTKLMVLS